MSNFFDYLICKKCQVKIDAKDYSYEESQKSMCGYCIEEQEEKPSENKTETVKEA